MDNELYDLNAPDVSSLGPDDVRITTKKPKRVIYFSDGPYEEYSDDEVDKEEKDAETVDPKNQTWPSYILSVLDSAGEKLAWFLGITSPKYQYAIDEYMRRKKEEEEDREFEKREEEARMERERRIKNDRKQNSDASTTDDSNNGNHGNNISIISASKPITEAEKIKIYAGSSDDGFNNNVNNNNSDGLGSDKGGIVSEFPEVVVTSEIPSKGFASGPGGLVNEGFDDALKF